MSVPCYQCVRIGDHVHSPDVFSAHMAVNRIAYILVHTSRVSCILTKVVTAQNDHGVFPRPTVVC